MAVGADNEPVLSFEDWYVDYQVDDRDGCLVFRNTSKWADYIWHEYTVYKREMDLRVANYEVLEKLADNEVISPKPDLPNIGSGETAGLIRRMARSLVQNTPNVEVVSKFNDDSIEGIFSRHVLTSKIIGTDQYSNDMQQNLFSSTKTSLTLGFACVIPVLLQDAGGSWYIKYDTIHYRDVYPEPGCKDIRDATCVFVRRYLTVGEVKQLIASHATGWDVNALRRLVQNRPPSREQQSVDRQTKKRGMTPDGYPIITWYDSSGAPFLTFDERDKTLLRIEKNKHPLKQHPVHFLVLEKDDQQPLGRSQVELLVGRQDFQDLMLNGAMKLWYRNINPSITVFGDPNAMPNLSPGKYTKISNPNARIEPFEVNTQTLMQYGTISQQNLGSMVNLIGNPDQQMGAQAGGGMSATPQGVDAQQGVVDITTNNYQKAIEAFFSHYCSYALTIFFAELQSIKKVTPTAEARIKLLQAGFPTEKLNDDGSLDIDFQQLMTEYWVRCVPGSLTELEDEKQLRVLNQLFVPLSQAMPAMAAAQDQEALKNATKAMTYIIKKQIELSGSASAKDIGLILTGDVDEVNERDAKIASLEENLGGIMLQSELDADLHSQAIAQLQEQTSMLTQNMGLLLEKLGVTNGTPETSSTTPGVAAPVEEDTGSTVSPASA